jgi:hypothetical protein
VRLVLQMQNRQVLAGAHIVSGMVAASDFFKEWEEARRCEMESAALLRSYDRDHLSEELAVLKLRVMRSIGAAHQLTLVVTVLLRPPLGLESLQDQVVVREGWNRPMRAFMRRPAEDLTAQRI